MLHLVKVGSLTTIWTRVNKIQWYGCYDGASVFHCAIIKCYVLRMLGTPTLLLLILTPGVSVVVFSSVFVKSVMTRKCVLMLYCLIWYSFEL